MLRIYNAVRCLPKASWKNVLRAGYVLLAINSHALNSLVKFLEQKHVGRDENTDSGGNDLVIGIQDLLDSLDLLALLNAVEEHLRRVSGGHGTVEQCVVIEQRHHVRLAV